MIKPFIFKTIKFYQKYFSPDRITRTTCRFYPSCSEYTCQAIEKYGLARGLGRGVWRIIRCNPWNPGGVDLP